jgi:rare lipoprotein A
MHNHSFYRRIALGLLFVSVVTLNGCATKHHKDGPPDYYVDETKIPNATPKVEPLSRIGNQPSYVVFGKRYYVMRSSKHYREQGIASWYGTQFHTHHTSNGERYNMLAMTAAHKTLPLPTYVQVTNLVNGRQIIVKVNDRGPFEANRLIDLSYVAAKKLGMLGHGTAKVDITAIDPAQ